MGSGGTIQQDSNSHISSQELLSERAIVHLRLSEAFPRLAGRVVHADSSLDAPGEHSHCPAVCARAAPHEVARLQRSHPPFFSHLLHLCYRLHCWHLHRSELGHAVEHHLRCHRFRRRRPILVRACSLRDLRHHSYENMHAVCHARHGRFWRRQLGVTRDHPPSLHCVHRNQYQRRCRHRNLQEPASDLRRLPGPGRDSHAYHLALRDRNQHPLPALRYLGREPTRREPNRSIRGKRERRCGNGRRACRRRGECCRQWV